LNSNSNMVYFLPFAAGGQPAINAGLRLHERDQRGRLRPDACDIGRWSSAGCRPSGPTGSRSAYHLALIARS
jgi:hypothetical protein